jgi:hypothetical protein
MILVTSEKYESLSGKFLFNKFGKREFIFDREYINNKQYLAEQAALCIHKTLIGISELKSIEEITGNSELAQLNMCKAINTYYVIFHMMTFCMLIDSQHNLMVMKGLKNGKVPFEINEKLLNSENEYPNTWDRQRFLEMDLATAITHSQIKEYCNLMRSGTISSNLVDVIFNHFIKEIPKTILYEKICYIRDRIIYRPTFVVEDKKGESIFTLKGLKQEINDLPTWGKLYSIVEELQKKMIESSGNNSFFYMVLSFMWRGLRVEEKRKDLIESGLSDEDFNQYSSQENDDIINLPYYISHMLQITDKCRINAHVKELWEPLRIQNEMYTVERISKIGK